jgi:hypothetical protein
MSSAVDNSTGELGNLLINVQSDLAQLRQKLTSQSDDGQKLEVQEIQSLLSRTEQSLKERANLLLQQTNKQVISLPPTSLQQDAKINTNNATSNDYIHDLKALTSKELVSYDTVHELPVTTGFRALTYGLQVTGPTPGENVKRRLIQGIVNDPSNKLNRETLNDNYGIQLPVINLRVAKPKDNGLIKGKLTEPLALLPANNRKDPQLLPPPITDADAQRGILSLQQRGFIPPAADLTLDPLPVSSKTAPIHSAGHKTRPPLTQQDNLHSKSLQHISDETVSQAASSSTLQRKASSAVQQESDASLANENKKQRRSSKKSQGKQHVPLMNLEMQPNPPPTTPANISNAAEKGYRFAIQKGKVRQSSSDFLAFKQRYCLSWGSIVTMLTHLENMMKMYSVPLAFIHGEKLSYLALQFELNSAPTVEDLLSVVVNREDVEALIKKPGQQYSGPNGKHMAATKIQATYRMHRDRAKYLEYRRKKWASGVIALTWLMHVKMTRVKKQLQVTRLEHLENHRIRMKYLASNWDRMKTSKRLIIHIPSLGYSSTIRKTVKNIAMQQNMQMARLCDLLDPNVDVIYVSPTDFSEEMLQYYSKLLGLRSAIDTGNADTQSDLGDRFKIVLPNAHKSFPEQHMSLMSLMKYSPKTLKRLKTLAQGRDAYIVGGIPSHDDLYVSNALDVPLLCTEPDLARLYRTKSGSKRIFASAGVKVPPSEYDIYTLSQLHDCLANLITENIEVATWIFKLDDEFDGRGTAFINVSKHMACYNAAVKEAKRYGDKWSKKWAQEATLRKVIVELPELLVKQATPVNKDIYPTWEKFVDAFLSHGGVIEAYAPSDSATCITADMLIAPTGEISLLCVGDQIHADSQFRFWGLSTPQSSIEVQTLNDACMKIASACHTRKIVGYITIDFVTFLHPKTMQQELWAIDLDIGYSDTLAMTRLVEYSLGTRFDAKRHVMEVVVPKKETIMPKSRRNRSKTGETNQATSRFAVVSNRIFHSNLAVVHYSVFFQMCRAHGIGYDVKEKQGTVFLLIDSNQRDKVGMITVGDNLQGTLAICARNLSVIHQEISTPSIQGHSNFKLIIEDIENILGTTVQNAAEEKSSSTLSTQSTTSSGH